MILEVDSENQAALGPYQSLGFKTVKRQDEESAFISVYLRLVFLLV
jgi:ribosomal protein S18 acetylase RimI-like enzyme